MDANENEVGLSDMPRIIDLVRHWSITTKREIIRDENGRATGAKDTEVENIGNRVADMLDQIYELARADRELLTKYLDSHIAHNEDKARLSEMAAEIIELLGRLPDAEV